MDYPAVDKAHLVPRFCMRRFSSNDQVIAHLVATCEERTVLIDDAAVRKRFYRRFRPDGTAIDDVEWSLSQLEEAVAP